MADAQAVLTRKLNTLNRRLESILDRSSLGLAKRIQNKHLSGKTTGRNRVASRSGALKNSVQVILAESDGNKVESTVRVTEKYAGVHFGRRGEETIIRPKSAKALTIPTSFAKNADGTVIGPATSPKFRDTFISNGNILGRVGSGSDIVPLFSLRNQVRVPVRIDIQDDLLRPATFDLGRRLIVFMRRF